MRSFFISLLGLLLAPISSFSYASPESISSVDEVFFENLIAKFQSKENTIHSVEEFISELPREIRSNYVLVYDSESPQEADFTNPRVILSSYDGKLIFTFNGASYQKRYQKIEAMRFKESHFELREFSFVNNRGTVSEKNPLDCLKCHGQDPRPFWDMYPFWPGVFGSIDDEANSLVWSYLADKRNPFNWAKTRRRAKSIEKNEEARALLKFLEGRSDHPRYRYLENYSPSPDQYSAFFRSNLEFGIALEYLNNKRIARIINHMPESHAFRNTIAASIVCNFGQLFPEDGPWKSKIKHYDVEILNLMKDSLVSRGVEISRNIIRSIPDSYNNRKKFLGLYMMSNLFSWRDISDFGMEFKVKAPILWTGVPNDDLANQVLKSLFTSEELNEMKPPLCRDLIEKSQSEILNLNAEDTVTAASGLTPYKKCMGCHSIQSGTPIPFDNLDALKSLKANNGNPMVNEIRRRLYLPDTSSEKMPREGTLSDDEILFLIDYIEN